MIFAPPFVTRVLSSFQASSAYRPSASDCPSALVRSSAADLSADDPARPALRARWLERNPKATIYIDLPDFAFVRLLPVSALLNGGFARAFRLSPEDL